MRIWERNVTISRASSLLRRYLIALRRQERVSNSTANRSRMPVFEKTPRLGEGRSVREFAFSSTRRTDSRLATNNCRYRRASFVSSAFPRQDFPRLGSSTPFARYRSVESQRVHTSAQLQARSYTIAFHCARCVLAAIFTFARRVSLAARGGTRGEPRNLFRC